MWELGDHVCYNYYDIGEVPQKPTSYPLFQQFCQLNNLSERFKDVILAKYGGGRLGSY
jgi:hypothetical protein